MRVTLYERGQIGAAAAYVAVSVVLSIGALFAGMTLCTEPCHERRSN